MRSQLFHNGNRATSLSPGLAETLKPGDAFSPECIGAQRMPRRVKELLRCKGLGYCSFTNKVVDIANMRKSYISAEGVFRSNLYYNARNRALHKRIAFDAEMMKQIGSRTFAECFCWNLLHTWATWRRRLVTIS